MYCQSAAAVQCSVVDRGALEAEEELRDVCTVRITACWSGSTVIDGLTERGDVQAVVSIRDVTVACHVGCRRYPCCMPLPVSQTATAPPLYRCPPDSCASYHCDTILLLPSSHFHPRVHWSQAACRLQSGGMSDLWVAADC